MYTQAVPQRGNCLVLHASEAFRSCQGEAGPVLTDQRQCLPQSGLSYKEMGSTLSKSTHIPRLPEPSIVDWISETPGTITKVFFHCPLGWLCGVKVGYLGASACSVCLGSLSHFHVVVTILAAPLCRSLSSGLRVKPPEMRPCDWLGEAWLSGLLDGQSWCQHSCYLTSVEMPHTPRAFDFVGHSVMPGTCPEPQRLAVFSPGR